MARSPFGRLMPGPLVTHGRREGCHASIAGNAHSHQDINLPCPASYMCRRGTVQGLFWPYETPILQEHLRCDDRGEPKGDDEVLEAIQVLGDGEINWVIATLIVAPRGRNRGIRTLERLDDEGGVGSEPPRPCLTEGEAPPFYDRLPGRQAVGFRLHRSPTP